MLEEKLSITIILKHKTSWILKLIGGTRGEGGLIDGNYDDDDKLIKRETLNNNNLKT